MNCIYYIIINYNKLFLKRTLIFIIFNCSSSQIYCESEFLHDVQLSSVFSDSKTFVDMKLLHTESEIISKYKMFKNNYNGVVAPNLELHNFVFDHLTGGDELEQWLPTDYVKRPPIVDRIKHAEYSSWAMSINKLWYSLARKVKDDVKTHPDMYSLIWVPNGFIIPGERFGELYYWDTYWIVKGLLLCDMKETAKGIIDNIVYLVEKFGFMPNGARIYYVTRSQPPMLIQMASVFYESTNDFEYIESVISVSPNGRKQIIKSNHARSTGFAFFPDSREGVSVLDAKTNDHFPKRW